MSGNEGAAVNDGRWYEVHWPYGEGSDIGLIVDRYDGQHVQFRRYNPVKVSACLEQGYKFTPLVALDAATVEALQSLCNVAEVELIEDTYKASGTDVEIKQSVELVRQLLAKVGG